MEVWYASNNTYISKALRLCAVKLTLEEFVTATKYPIDPIIFKHFGQALLNNQCIHISKALLKYFGDKETHRRRPTYSVITLIKRAGIPYRELTFKDDLTAYPTIQAEIEESPKNAIYHTKWMIMTPHNMKRVIKKFRTKYGHMICDRYFDLEELIETYKTYLFLCREREAHQEIAQLKQDIANLKQLNQQILEQYSIESSTYN